MKSLDKSGKYCPTVDYYEVKNKILREPCKVFNERHCKMLAIVKVSGRFRLFSTVSDCFWHKILF